jgi:chromosome partitioning related protein ParA
LADASQRDLFGEVRMLVITVMSTKGGVGKTTLTANLGGIFADFGLRTLLFDADTQPSLTQYYQFQEQAPKGLTEVILSGSITPECISRLALIPTDTTRKKLPLIHPSGRLDLIQSDDRHDVLQPWLTPRVDRGVRIKNALRNPAVSENYDVVLIDTQGAMGSLLEAAIFAADILVSPVVPTALSAREFYHSTQELLGRLEQGKNIGLNVPPIKAVLYMSDNTKDSKAYADVIRESVKNLPLYPQVLDVFIPHAVAYKDATTERMPVHLVDPGKAGLTMHQLAWELVPELNGVQAPSLNAASKIDEQTFKKNAVAVIQE